MDSDHSTGLQYPTFEQLGPDSFPSGVRFKIYLEWFMSVKLNVGIAAYSVVHFYDEKVFLNGVVSSEFKWMPSLKDAWCREYVLWNQHSFFCLLPCIGDHKKVESEVLGATGGVEEDPVLLTEGEDG